MFKVGDWVRHRHNSTIIEQVKSVDDKEGTFECNWSWASSNDDFILWEPQEEGQWCWFYFSENVSVHKCLTLGRYIGSRNRTDYELFLEYYDTDNNICAADSCEPFIGQPPSFIKEQQC